jgi:hypothetical protein
LCSCNSPTPPRCWQRIAEARDSCSERSARRERRLQVSRGIVRQEQDQSSFHLQNPFLFIPAKLTSAWARGRSCDLVRCCYPVAGGAKRSRHTVTKLANARKPHQMLWWGQIAKRVLAWVDGGAEGIRTPDLFRAREALSQLSHCPRSTEIIPSRRAKGKRIWSGCSGTFAASITYAFRPEPLATAW